MTLCGDLAFTIMVYPMFICHSNGTTYHHHGDPDAMVAPGSYIVSEFTQALPTQFVLLSLLVFFWVLGFAQLVLELGWAPHPHNKSRNTQMIRSPHQIPHLPLQRQLRCVVGCEETTKISCSSVYGRQDEILHAICPRQVSTYYPHFLEAKLNYQFSVNQCSEVCVRNSCTVICHGDSYVSVRLTLAPHICCVRRGIV